MEGYIAFENDIVENSFYNSIRQDLIEGCLLRGESISISFDAKDHVIDADDIVLKLRKRQPTDEFASVFFGQLSESNFGRVLIHAKCVSSTMDVAHLLNKYVPDGLVVLAETQRKGRGRGKTSWESPKGCAMFTFNVGYPAESQLAQNPAFLGYITSCAVVKAVQQMTGNAINLNIKWPNDIFASHHSKIGGTLHDLIDNGVVIGVGLNVANDKPTVCLNSLIKEHNKTIQDYLTDKKLVVAQADINQFLINFLKCYVIYFEQFQRGDRGDLLQLYFDSWIHQNRLYSKNIEPENLPYDVIVKGLDSKGWLLVERVSNQSEESITPHGMSLDVWNGIIYKKPNE